MCIAFNINHSSILPFMALSSLYCADVPLSNYSLTHWYGAVCPGSAACGSVRLSPARSCYHRSTGLTKSRFLSRQSLRTSTSLEVHRKRRHLSWLSLRTTTSHRNCWQLVWWSARTCTERFPKCRHSASKDDNALAASWAFLSPFDVTDGVIQPHIRMVSVSNNITNSVVEYCFGGFEGLALQMGELLWCALASLRLK